MVAHNLGHQGQVMNEVEGEFEASKIVSSDLELPQIVGCVPRSFPQVMIQGGVQRATILVIVAQNHADDMGVRSHDNSSKACRYTPAMVVGNDAGHIVGPVVVVEAYGKRCLSSSWHASRQQFSSATNDRRNSWYSCSQMASLRPHTPLTLGSALLGWSRSAGHSADSGTGG